MEKEPFSQDTDYILNPEWEDIHLNTPERSFREKTEEELQLGYFHKGEAIDLDYVLDINPSMKHYFGSMLDSGVATEIPVEINGELRHLVQLTDDPELGEPAFDPYEDREWRELL